MGYHRAGFDVTGVDVKPQPHYPFAFIQGDALAYLVEHGHQFDAIHASPPCQAFTQMSAKHRGRGGAADQHPDLLTPTRVALLGDPRPWVIENVQGAKHQMRSVLILHGGMFGIGVNRPRLFESNILVPTPAYGPRTVDPIGVYGSKPDARRLWTRRGGSRLRVAGDVAEAQRVMDIDWMPEWRELCEAIPPAYTEWIGRHLLAALRADEAAS